MAERLAFEAKQKGGESLYLEILEPRLCNIKRNADELLNLFSCLKAAKWDEEKEEEKENGED